ncbi:DNA replication/repair protein RecF [Candidatus Magnetaquicoccus inordinatus]|uniref:DNA replication/repair protein RecF n=1 Tax=Candidatus Magnetaquicoccus inordinatus TaxID=2496818 RepID=UPI00102C0AF2|nr:DNA replication/repair protein RecF [Candidatus Magnetaquicoccus inordinatus]
MKLERLRVSHFRNMAHAALEWDARINLLLGDNGHGKTNVLEAIGLLATGRSFRRASAVVMRRQGQEGFSLQAEVERAGLRHQLSFMTQGAQQQVRLNGKGVAALSGLAQIMTAVVLTPDAPALLRGPPEERRNYLDWIIFTHQRSHAVLVRDYQTALRARNHLLRSQCSDGRQYEAWEEQLAALGARIYQERLAMMRLMVQRMEGYLQALALDGSEYGWRLSSETVAGEEPEGELPRAQQYREALQRSRQGDQRGGSTSIGPHRDDPQFWQGKKILARFASRGQQKRFLLALKLTEADLLQERLGEPPLLLLDDPATELDQEGVRRLLQILAGTAHQLFIAVCAEDGMVWPQECAVKRFWVREGVVQALAGATSWGEQG